MNDRQKVKAKPVVVTILFLAGLVAINYLLSTFYREQISFTSKKATRFRHFVGGARKNGCDILVLGDSHPLCAILPGSFKRRVTKLTDGGEPYFKSYYKLRYVVTQVDIPEILILPIDQISFRTSYACKNFSRGDDAFWVDIMDYPEFGKVINKKSLLLKKYIRGRFAPYTGSSFLFYQWLVKGLLVKGSPLFAPTAAKPQAPKKKKRPRVSPAAKKKYAKKQEGKQARKQVKKHVHKHVNKHVNKQAGKFKKAGKNNIPRAKRKSSHPAFSNRIARQLKNWPVFTTAKVYYFKKILETCREHNIQVVLVRYPVSREYYQFVGKHMMPTQKYYDKVKRLYSGYKNIHVLDYHDIFFSRPQFMLDPSHVNMKGARIVSKAISRDIERLFPLAPKRKSAPKSTPNPGSKKNSRSPGHK